MAKSKANADNAESIAADAGDNVEQIRDILFGSQMRDYESRFRDLEKHVDAESKKIRDDLAAAVKDHRNALQKEIQKLAESMAGARQELAAQVADLDSRVSGESAQTQSDLQDAIRDLQRTLDERAAHIEDMLDRQAREINADKAGREELADLLTMTAKRLVGDSHKD